MSSEPIASVDGVLTGCVAASTGYVVSAKEKEDADQEGVLCHCRVNVKGVIRVCVGTVVALAFSIHSPPKRYFVDM